MAVSPEDLATLHEILRLRLGAAEGRAVELKLKRKGVGWGKDGTPEKSLDAILPALIQRTFNFKTLELLALSTKVKEKGVGWGTKGMPKKTKEAIALAIVARRREILSADLEAEATPSTAPADESEGEAGPADAAPSGPDGGAAEEAAEEYTVADHLFEDFHLPDLIALAERYGIKRNGIGWGKDGTPVKKKSDIVAALIRHKEEEAESGKTEKDVAAVEADAGSEESCELHRDELKKMQSAGWENFQVQEEDAPTSYMSRAAYRTHLLAAGLLEKSQDVFHIVASANGGPDHPDNYLGALGSAFNRSLGVKYDAFCCFLAGPEKAQKAVQRAMEAEALYRQDPEKYAYVFDKSRGKSKPILYSENVYNQEAGRLLSGEDLVERGRELWFNLRFG